MIEGRVELCYDGLWGLVCDNTWDSEDAATVCRLLGLQQDGTNIFVLRSLYTFQGQHILGGSICKGLLSTLLIPTIAFS
jgi:hypothetical protein